MKTGILLILFGLGYVFLNDLLFYLEIRKRLRPAIFRWVFWFHSLLFMVGMILYHLLISGLEGPEIYYWASLGISVLLLFYVPKSLYILFNGLANLFLIFRLRRTGRLTTLLARGIAGFSFLLILYGITWGKYDYKVIRQEVAIRELPDAFRGFTIVQLTDLHLGSMGKHNRGMEKLVEKVGALKPDLIVFTGDMINNFASEMLPWISTLRKLQAPFGVFAVTGNHDYGDYTRWKQEADKIKNREDFQSYMQQAGFKILNNTHVPLVIGTDTLCLCGVENWGNPPFPRYGKLKEALKGIGGHVVILLSHDPMHWREEVIDYPVALTLSGHTHAMQLGISIGNFNWSPAKYFYPEYNGLYETNGKQLYVSRGEGFLGLAGRIGQRPEITLIRLTNTDDDEQ